MTGRVPAVRSLRTVASCAFVVLGVGLLTDTVAMAAEVGEESTDTQLAELFAPVIALREQSSACGEGEPYYPVAVDELFGRDDVVIRDAAGDVLVDGPTIDDLAGLDADSWIDIPGDALRPGCDYEQWFDALEAPPTVYARVDPRSGRFRTDRGPVLVLLPVQRLERPARRRLGDGPGRLRGVDRRGRHQPQARPCTPSPSTREPRSPSVATTSSPSSTRRIRWCSRPRARTPPTSRRSRWFGKSAATGFGCDDTRAPLDEVRPAVVLLPADAATTGEFAWLSFPGRLG